MAVEAGQHEPERKRWPVAKAQWGLKRVCQQCGAAFYDLRRHPIVCPKCGATFDPEAFTKVRRPRAAPEKAPPREVAAKEQDNETEGIPADADDFETAAEEGGEDEEEMIEDVSELGEDDDVPKVVESVDSSERS